LIIFIIEKEITNLLFTFEIADIFFEKDIICSGMQKILFET